MASSFSPVCFVRCPKCLRVLAEFPEIPLFKCYGCDVILNAKVHADSCSSDNGLSVYVKQISNASDEPTRHEDEVDSSVNGIRTLSVSGSSKEKRESAAYELNGINGGNLEQDRVNPSSQSGHNLNQKARKSSNQIGPEANDCLNSSSHKLEEQSPESLGHGVKDKQGDEGLINGFGFRWRTRTSHAYDRSFSLSDKLRQDHVTQKLLAVSRRTRSSRSYERSFSSSGEHRLPQMHPAVSRRTRSRKVWDSADGVEAAGVEEQSVVENRFSKASNLSSGNGEEQSVVENRKLSLISQSKDGEQVVKFDFSEADDQLKILEKVDELKIELHRMFSNKSAGKEASSFSIMVTHLEGKIESNDNRSSLFRISRQTSNSSCLLCRSPAMCSHNGNRRLCQESQIRHCRPVSGGAPFVICYKCYKLLQLPVDFLVSTKRFHKLRCGSCSEVLVYSFRPRSRAVINKRY